MIAKLLKMFHVHRWEDTLWNNYSMGVEQKCRCGKIRHHLSSDIINFDITWKEGEHPYRHLAK